MSVQFGAPLVSCVGLSSNPGFRVSKERIRGEAVSVSCHGKEFSLLGRRLDELTPVRICQILSPHAYRAYNTFLSLFF